MPTQTAVTSSSLTAHRGELLHCIGNPFMEGKAAVQHIPDALLIIDQGTIVACGEYAALHPQWTTVLQQSRHTLQQHRGLLVPGFVDCHVHYPQLDIIGSYGNSLLDWLERYTFPAEKAFADYAHALHIAERFVQALLQHGTTSAMVYGTVHAHSVDAFFNVAAPLDLRMICGKALMDRNAPPYLQDTATQGYQDTLDLIQRWHGKARLAIAVTPRFAPTSTPEQLRLAGDLLRAYPDVYLQTHLSESCAEVDWVKTLYPQAQHYLDVYEHAGLLGPRSIFGHAIHLNDEEWSLLHARQARIAHCPSSNFFLGSGLFDAQRAQQENVMFGLGSDVGAGTSLSMLDTAGDAYLVSALKGHPLHPEEMFYLLTLGGARTLQLDHCIGNFAVGKEADFLVIEPPDEPLLNAHLNRSDSPLEKLFHLAITKQGANAVRGVYIKGVKQPPASAIMPAPIARPMELP